MSMAPRGVYVACCLYMDNINYFVQLWLIRGDWRHPRMTTIPSNLVFQLASLVLVSSYMFSSMESEQAEYMTQTPTNSRLMELNRAASLMHGPSSISPPSGGDIPFAYCPSLLHPASFRGGGSALLDAKGCGVCTSFKPQVRHHTTVL